MRNPTGSLLDFQDCITDFSFGHYTTDHSTIVELEPALAQFSLIGIGRRDGTNITIDTINIHDLTDSMRSIHQLISDDFASETLNIFRNEQCDLLCNIIVVVWLARLIFRSPVLILLENEVRR